MAMTNLSLSQPMIEEAVPHRARCGGKPLALLSLLLTSGCAVLWVAAGHSASPQLSINPINMAWQTATRMGQATQPLKAWQPFRQPVLQPARAFRSESSFPQSNKINEIPATATEIDIVPLSRRDTLLGALLAGGSVLGQPALAILQPNDEEDEALLAKAKANRAERRAAEKKREQEFARTEGFKKNARLDAQLAPIQKSLRQLSKVAEDISNSNTGGAAGELKDAAITNLATELDILSLDGDAKALTFPITNNIKKLEGLLEKNDASGAKATFKDVIDEFVTWAKASQLEDKLPGLSTDLPERKAIVGGDPGYKALTGYFK